LPSVIELFGKLFSAWGARVLLTAMKSGGGFNVGPELFTAIGILLVGLVICVPAEVWLTMKQLAYVRMIVNGVDDYKLAYKQVGNRFWAVIFYAITFYFFFFIWVFVWAFAFSLAGMLAKLTAGLALLMVPLILVMMILAGASLLVMLLPLTLVFVVLACEDLGFFETLGRAFSMTLKNFFSTIGFCLSLFSTWLALYLALTMVLQIVYGIEYFRSGVYSGQKIASEVQMPIYIQIFAGVWNSIIYMYLMPVFYVASGYFYYSLRMRKEGLDLSHKLERLEKQRDAFA